jgi:hypothetical protein
MKVILRMNLNKDLLTVFLFSLIAAQAQSQTPMIMGGNNGSLAGRVVNEAGKGVPGAFVALLAELRPGQAPKDFQASAHSTAVDSEGRFGFLNVVPGRYKICTEATHTGHLNNCQWGANVVVDVEAGRVSGPHSIRLNAGQRVQVLVSDPKGLIGKEKRIQAMGIIQAFIANGGAFLIPFRTTKDDGKELVLSTLVPADREVRVSIGSGVWKFKDEDKAGPNLDKKSDEYRVIPGDARSREIKISLQSLDKAK